MLVDLLIYNIHNNLICWHSSCSSIQQRPATSAKARKLCTGSYAPQPDHQHIYFGSACGLARILVAAMPDRSYAPFLALMHPFSLIDLIHQQKSWWRSEQVLRELASSRRNKLKMFVSFLSLQILFPVSLQDDKDTVPTTFLHCAAGPESDWPKTVAFAV